MIGVLIGFYVLFPALVLFLAYRYPTVNKIGPVIVCYIAGIAVASWLPHQVVFPLQNQASGLSVALALPLLLFSMDLRRWGRLAGKTLVSMGLAIVAITVVSFAGYLVLRHFMPDAWKIAGMAIGVYTGGTPNLAAIKTALGVDPSTFIIVHTYDTLWSLFYVIFMMSVAQRLFLKFLPPFRGDGKGQKAESIENIKAYKALVTPDKIPGLAAALAVSMGISLVAWAVKGIVPLGSRNPQRS